MLKGTDTFISEDVCKDTLPIRREKLGLLKDKRDEGFVAYFSGVNAVFKQRHNRQVGGVQTVSTAEERHSQTEGDDSEVTVDLQSII